MGQLRENHKITNMSYQKAAVDDIESSTRSNKTPPNTPEKSQLKKWLGIAGAIALLIVIATAIGYGIHANQSKCQNDGKSEKGENGTFICDCEGTGFDGQFCQNATTTKTTTKNVCLPDFCQNNGECSVNEANLIKCECL